MSSLYSVPLDGIEILLPVFSLPVQNRHLVHSVEATEVVGDTGKTGLVLPGAEVALGDPPCACEIVCKTEPCFSRWCIEGRRDAAGESTGD